jgi:ribonucleoside-diphosphate reductase alpha chain
MKLDSLAKARDEQGFPLAMPPSGERVYQNGVVAAFANIVRWRCEQLGAFKDIDQHATPVLNALFSKKEPKAGPLGTMSWTVDISNATTGDDFVLGVKELHLPDGSRRPYSIWLAGEYPKVLDGLCKLISLDMRVVDANWIGLKLRKLLNFGEQNGEFWASRRCCCIVTRCSASSTTKAARSSRPASSRCPTRSRSSSTRPRR